MSFDEQKAYIWRKAQEKGIVFLSQLERIVEKENAHMGPDTIGRILDELTSEGKLVRSPVDYMGYVPYYLKESDPAEIQDRITEFGRLVREHSGLKVLIGSFKVKLAAKAIDELIQDNDLDLPRHTILELEKTERQNIPLEIHRGSRRKDIDIFLKKEENNRTKYHINIEVKNGVTPVLIEDVSDVLAKSSLAAERWRNTGVREVRSAVIASFFDNNAKESCEEMNVRFVETGKVYLPRGQHEEILRRYNEVMETDHSRSVFLRAQRASDPSEAPEPSEVPATFKTKIKALLEAL